MKCPKIIDKGRKTEGLHIKENEVCAFFDFDLLENLKRMEQAELQL
jgi:hypothetical protein